MEGADGAQQQQQLVAELCQVQEIVRQLELHLHAPSPTAASVGLCRRLAAEIVALTDRSIGMAAVAAIPPPPLPHSGAPSPLSDAGSDQHSFRTAGSPKKRKATARWSGQVRVSAAAGGAEGGPADDGHCWRKYGQKDILGARHPRAYYRCTHRNSQGCPATKQVQRTDDDPALFDVVYHGEHTCRPGATGGSRRPPQQQHNPHHAESLLESLGARLTVATADGVAVAPPLTPESSAPSPWSLASPVGSDSNGVYVCPLAGYGEWTLDGDLQEVVSGFAAASVAHLPVMDTELMPPEYFGFDSSFDFASMPSLFS